MRKYLLASVSLLIVVTLLAACGPQPTEAPPVEEPTEVPFRVGYVTDTGGIDNVTPEAGRSKLLHMTTGGSVHLVSSG